MAIGLLGNLTDDPSSQGSVGLLGMDPYSLAMITRLWTARRGENWGNDIAAIASQAQQNHQQQQRMAMEQARFQREQRDASRQDRINALPAQFARPGAAPLTPNDDEGNPMPSAPASFDMRGYSDALMAEDPRQALALQAQMAQMNQRNLQKIGKGESLYDVGAGRTIAQGSPDLPTGMRMGANGPEYIPEYLQGQQQIRAAGKPQTNVTVQGEKAFTTEMAKLDAKQLDELRGSAMKAQNGLSRIAEMKRLSDQGVYSGWGAQGRAGVANFFNTIGAPMDPRKLQNSQEYLKHAKELTLSMLKEGVGANQISNADREFVDATVPQLETNPQARMNLLNYMEQRLGSSVQRFQDADAYARSHSGLGGFNYQPRQQQAPSRASGPLQRNTTALYKAQQAIKSGKNREAVIQRLVDEGYDPSGL